MRPSILVLLFMALFSWDCAAKEMRLTIYDDGLSCPAGCDPHVVINQNDNGTRFAFHPDSTRTHPEKCTEGKECRICFGEDDITCMIATYRGGGAPKGTFDFTPDFYEKNCERHDIPSALHKSCLQLDGAVTRLGYGSRVNCFTDKTNPACISVLSDADTAQRLDIPEREKCLALGENAFNKMQAGIKKQRTNQCNYSKALLGGPNSSGVRWRILLPAACRSGTYVGNYGTDCCSSNLRFAAKVHPECAIFFQNQIEKHSSKINFIKHGV